MSEETTQVETQAQPDVSTPAPETAPEKSFSFDDWKERGGTREELPCEFRGVHDHFKDHYERRDSFNAVKELRGLIDEADKRAGASANNRQQQQTVPDGEVSEADIERMVQERVSQKNVQQRVTGFRSDFERMVKDTINVGDGHKYDFSSKKELENFVNYSRNVLNSGQISPKDLYKLWNFERILADVGEWQARKHEESLRKVSAGSSTNREEASTDTKTTSSRGERNEADMTVEEIMKSKFPEIYGDMVSGSVRFG